MKKNFLVVIMVLISALACALGLAGCNIKDGGSGGGGRVNYDLEFTLSDSKTEYKVSGIGSCTDTEIVIPSEYEGLPVTSIGGYAFKNCKWLTSITISDSVTSISDYAFEDCIGLTSISIPDSVTSIGYDAFRGCISLTSITLPDSVTSIGRGAFSSCSSLTNISIPDSVTSIGGVAFGGCISLTNITIPDSVTNIGEGAFSGCYRLIEVYNKSTLNIIAGSIDNGCVAFYAKNVYTTEGGSKLITDENGYIIYDGNTLVSYVGSATGLIIPDTVTIINQYAFSNYIYGNGMYFDNGLTSVIIPDGVTEIGAYAFDYCYGLTSVTLGKGVNKIGECAFRGCYRLIEVYNKSTLNITAGGSIDNGCVAFYAENVYTAECGSRLTTDKNGFVIYDGDTVVNYVGTATEIAIPDCITAIKWRAFYNCNNLTSITLPDSVTSIGDSAFNECSNLTSITLPDSVTSIGDWAFYYCKKLTSVTIPDSVTSIGKDAFWGCSGLTSVTIGNSVTNIGNSAFFSCYCLVEVYNKSSLNIVAGSEDYGMIGFYAKNVYTTEGGSKLTTDKNGFVIYGGNTLVNYVGKKNEVTIPNGITVINSHVFSNRKGLMSITLPDGVKSISRRIAYNCIGLLNINFNGTKEQWDAMMGHNWYVHCNLLGKITVHCTDGNIEIINKTD